MSVIRIGMTASDSKWRRDVSMASTDSRNVSKSASRVDIYGLAVKSSDDRQSK